MYYNYRKPIIWDLEECPLLRGLLYCVPISECPLSEVFNCVHFATTQCILFEFEF